jgi:hypothetical protein
VLDLAGAVPSDSKRKIDLPLEQWLAAGEKKELKGKLKVLKPFLTFQQRQRIRVIATYDLNAIQKAGAKRDLHFILKVGDSEGKWFSGESYTGNSFESQIKGNPEIEIISEVNALPGKYRVAAILYDSELKQRSVFFDDVKVSPVKHDPLPEADRDLPRVEFLPPSERNVSQFGDGRLNLSVQNQRPLQIDVIFDVSAQGTRRSVASLGSAIASRQVQVVNAISDMKLQSGCMRLTGVDLLRQELLFERIDTRAVDWFKVREEILKRNLHTISVEQLSGEDQVAPFFKMQIEKTLGATPGCTGRVKDKPKRVVMILSSGVLLPPGSKKVKAAPDPTCDCEIFYIRAAPVQLFDDLPSILNDLSPHKIEAEDPYKFRENLRRLIAQLEQISRLN